MRIELTDMQARLPSGASSLLPYVGDSCLSVEGLSGMYQVSLLICDGNEIRAINAEQRGIDAETDVLSFPSITYKGTTAAQSIKRLRRELDVETGCAHLGDIVISMPRAMQQAEAYGHALLREVCFLFAHGMLHLMGYDHMNDAERYKMRHMEERIMDKAGLSRDFSDVELEMMALAREAMQKAYAPYSKYRVGACLRAKDGRLFSGCNVENASFGMTICAERNAATTAVAEGACTFDAIAIAAEGAMPYPCGACRQFLREFGKELTILVTNGEGAVKTTLAALLPESFGPESLPDAVK